MGTKRRLDPGPVGKDQREDSSLKEARGKRMSDRAVVFEIRDIAPQAGHDVDVGEVRSESQSERGPRPALFEAQARDRDCR